MDVTKSTEAPLQKAGTSGSHVTAAFEQLNNEIRLSILLTLWEAYDPYGTNEPVSFSELYDSVPVGDSANFTYHLDKLTGHFVEKTDDEYKLRNAGSMIDHERRENEFGLLMSLNMLVENPPMGSITRTASVPNGFRRPDSRTRT